MLKDKVISVGEMPKPVPSDIQVKVTSKKQWCVIHANYFYTDCTICLLVVIARGMLPPKA